MVKGLAFFFIVWAVVFGIGYWLKTSNKDAKYSVAKLTFWSGITASVALVLVTLIVAVF